MKKLVKMMLVAGFASAAVIGCSEDTEDAVTAIDSPIIGVWETSGDGVQGTYTFDADGDYTLDMIFEMGGEFELTDDSIFLTMKTLAGEKVPSVKGSGGRFAYTVDGSNLILTDTTGVKEFTKK